VTKKAVWAAFDFDGTLTRRDSLLAFLLFFLGTRRLLSKVAAELPVLAGYVAGVIPNHAAKERFLVRCLGGQAVDRVRESGRRFAEQDLPRLLRPEMMRRLNEHWRLGHTCVLVSASLDVYLLPWAHRAGFHHVLCSQLEVDPAGNLSGRLLSGNCYGPEKARRLAAILPDSVELYVYGDSRGDREMLAMADHRYYRGQHV
jgi:phosphatidylglycerophosphatase C